MTLADEVLTAKTCDQAPNESGKAKGTDAEDVGPKKPWCFGGIDITDHLICCRQPALRCAPSGDSEQAGAADNARCWATPFHRDVPCMVSYSNNDAVRRENIVASEVTRKKNARSLASVRFCLTNRGRFWFKFFHSRETWGNEMPPGEIPRRFSNARRLVIRDRNPPAIILYPRAHAALR